MNKYLILKERVELRKYVNNPKTMLVVFKNRLAKNLDDEDFENIRTFTLNETATEIIQLIDGTRTYDEIVSFLSKKYHEENLSIEKKIDDFFEYLEHIYKIHVITQNLPEKFQIKMVNDRMPYPKVATLELTNKCNIRCLHCYGNFGMINGRVMSLNEAKNLLSDLRNIGVQVIELTGGDISIYPYLKEILLYAVSLDFHQISMLTNGIALSNRLLDIIIKNKDKMYVQIDMHSLDDNYLTWFTKVSNTLYKIQKNIIKLSSNGVKMRIVSVVTHRNVQEIYDIAEWVHALGIKHYGISPVIPVGRGLDADNNLYLNEDDQYKLVETLKIVTEKYPSFMSIYDGNREDIRNCGVLSSHVVIDSNGDIKICAMDNREIGMNIGNVFENSIEKIYDQNSDFINAMFSLQSPRLDSHYCSNCESKNFCFTCILRAFTKASEIGENCKWYKYEVPEVIKNKLVGI